MSTIIIETNTTNESESEPGVFRKIGSKTLGLTKKVGHTSANIVKVPVIVTAGFVDRQINIHTAKKAYRDEAALVGASLRAKKEVKK